MRAPLANLLSQITSLYSSVKFISLWLCRLGTESMIIWQWTHWLHVMIMMMMPSSSQSLLSARLSTKSRALACLCVCVSVCVSCVCLSDASPYEWVRLPAKYRISLYLTLHALTFTTENYFTISTHRHSHLNPGNEHSIAWSCEWLRHRRLHRPYRSKCKHQMIIDFSYERIKCISYVRSAICHTLCTLVNSRQHDPTLTHFS